MAGERSDLVRIGETSWRLWRECLVRSAGFPATGVEQLCDLELTELARRARTDARCRAGFDQRWPAALERAQETTRRLAAEPRFREAVGWQNPDLIRNQMAATRYRRRHELAIASYAQRYFVKNDTIGFFGPLAWARWTDGAMPLVVVPGPELVASRSVYFEAWAIDTLARSLSSDPGLQAWLRPRLVASYLMAGTTLHRPREHPLRLTEDHAALLSRCDGTRTVAQLAIETGAPVEAVLARLRAWRDASAVHLSLEGPIEARPELTLRRRLEQVADPAPRERALTALGRLEAAREPVARTAGDPEALMAATTCLNHTFERLTGHAATRRAGQTYAGRTLTYLEATRDVRVELGRPLAALVAAPLGLVLDSARWLLASTAERYEQVLLDLFAACANRAGTTSVPLPMLTSAATPHLMAKRPQPFANTLSAFQEAWARILDVPPGARTYAVAVESVAPRVRAEFPARPPRWAAAIHQSPDLLFATSGQPPWRSEDITVVLGELHLARNTLDNRTFVKLHEDPGRLLAAVEADYGTRRVVHVAPKEWPEINARTYPPPLLSPQFTYWCLYNDTSGAPGPVLPAAGLTVHLRDGRLVVRSGPDGVELDLLEVLGEQLSHVVVGGFSIMPRAAHRPRVSIGSLVLQRESWGFDPGYIAWAQARHRAERFRLAQGWRESYGLPERAFYTTGREKPRFVDFRSVSLVELLARSISQAAADPRVDHFSLTEMLPDLGQGWLVDADGAQYTAEVRCVAVDQA